MSNRTLTHTSAEPQSVSGITYESQNVSQTATGPLIPSHTPTATETLAVMCGDGRWVVVDEVQVEGKVRMLAKDFAVGYMSNGRKSLVFGRSWCVFILFSLSYSHTLCLLFTHSLSLIHTHSLSHSHTYTLSLPFTHTLSLSHSHTHSLSHSHTHSHSHTRIHTHAHYIRRFVTVSPKHCV